MTVSLQEQKGARAWSSATKMKPLALVTERDLLMAVYDTADEDGWTTSAAVVDELAERGYVAHGRAVATLLERYSPDVVEKGGRHKVTPPGGPVMLWSLTEEMTVALLEDERVGRRLVWPGIPVFTDEATS